MTLRRRLILAVLAAVTFAWVLTSALIYLSAQEEINELYDTAMVRMAQQMQALLPRVHTQTSPAPPSGNGPIPGDADLVDEGSAGLGDLAIAAWRPDGEPLHIDPDGDHLPLLPDVQGFTEREIDGVPWRLYYLNDPAQGWRVCVGQVKAERGELIVAYLQAQVLPWVFGLPLLTTLLLWGVSRALHPVLTLSKAIAARVPGDPTPLTLHEVPRELVPLVTEMNKLLSRATALLEHERRLTADAAHELRTPLAALKAQWEVARRSDDPAERSRAAANVEAGIDGMSRLVSQLLTMSRLEDEEAPPTRGPVDWREVSRQVLSDCLLLSERRNVDMEVLWPPAGQQPLPVNGDPTLLGTMLRNLVDNAIRYSPAGTVVTLAFEPDRITVSDRGPGVAPELLRRLGDRFFRAAGQQEQGNGLGISIARRVAVLHGLALEFANRQDGDGSGLVAAIRLNGMY
ncbi:ATP-binding protein [Cupriavidus metallidurans]|uniref:ATP-binding protein n=1 Tax=Cupriavidus TaxID=106589 RepID=UPI0002A42F61|nr:MULTISPECIES: ATP-binding protein [Cupriavidus]ELA01127.1 sensory histidine kinase in two-component regulatory system with QseB [Cupriavidus sp. HMR-1]GMG93910.1 sensor protein QseC [Cupriavidus sp. TKC]